jgi:hypothetical protein
MNGFDDCIFGESKDHICSSSSLVLAAECLISSVVGIGGLLFLYCIPRCLLQRRDQSAPGWSHHNGQRNPQLRPGSCGVASWRVRLRNRVVAHSLAEIQWQGWRFRRVLEPVAQDGEDWNWRPRIAEGPLGALPASGFDKEAGRFLRLPRYGSGWRVCLPTTICERLLRKNIISVPKCVPDRTVQNLFVT